MIDLQNTGSGATGATGLVNEDGATLSVNLGGAVNVENNPSDGSTGLLNEYSGADGGLTQYPQGPATVDNSGSVAVSGMLLNYADATITNESSGTITNGSSGTITNGSSGTIFNNFGTIINTNTINNFGMISNSGTIAPPGTINEESGGTCMDIAPGTGCIW